MRLGSDMLIEDTMSCEVNLLGMLFFKSLMKGFPGSSIYYLLW